MWLGLGAGQLGRLEDQLLQAVHGLLQALPRHVLGTTILGIGDYYWVSGTIIGYWGLLLGIGDYYWVLGTILLVLGTTIYEAQAWHSKAWPP